MDEPEYKNVLEALNSLISEKPKAGDKQAYEAAYESMQTYLEVLNLMLLVRRVRAECKTQLSLLIHDDNKHAYCRDWTWCQN